MTTKFISSLLGVSVVVGIGLTFFAEAQYKASATLNVGPANIQTQIQKLQSRPVLTQTLYVLQSKSGLKAFDNSFQIQKRLRVKSVKNNAAVEISFSDKDPKRAAAVVNAIGTTFITQEQFLNEQDSQRQKESLEIDLSQSEQQLRNTEAQLAVAKKHKQQALIQTLDKKIEYTTQRYEKLLSQYQDLKSDKGSAAKIAFIESASSDIKPSYPSKKWFFLFGFFATFSTGWLFLKQRFASKIPPVLKFTEFHKSMQRPDALDSFLEKPRVEEGGDLTSFHVDTPKEESDPMLSDMDIEAEPLPETLLDDAVISEENFPSIESPESAIFEPVPSDSQHSESVALPVKTQTGFQKTWPEITLEDEVDASDLVQNKFGVALLTSEFNTDFALSAMDLVHHFARYKRVLLIVVDGQSEFETFFGQKPALPFEDFLNGTLLMDVVTPTDNPHVVWQTMTADGFKNFISKDDLSFYLRRIWIYVDVICVVSKPFAAVPGFADNAFIISRGLDVPQSFYETVQSSGLRVLGEWI